MFQKHVYVEEAFELANQAILAQLERDEKRERRAERQRKQQRSERREEKQQQRRDSFGK